MWTQPSRPFTFPSGLSSRADYYLCTLSKGGHLGGESSMALAIWTMRKLIVHSPLTRHLYLYRTSKGSKWSRKSLRPCLRFPLWLHNVPTRCKIPLPSRLPWPFRRLSAGLSVLLISLTWQLQKFHKSNKENYRAAERERERNVRGHRFPICQERQCNCVGSRYLTRGYLQLCE